MGRKPNDGRGRLGGRAKGTPNKPTTPVQEWLGDLLNKHRAEFETELATGGEKAPTVYAALILAKAILLNTEALTRCASLREQSTEIAERAAG